MSSSGSQDTLVHPMDDSEYETAVARYLVGSNPEYEVNYNHRVVGCKSGVSRQVDVLLTKRSDRSRVVVECKYYRRKLDIKLVEAFIGFLQDVDILDGILVTNVGVSKAALCRISECLIRIRVLAEADLTKYRIGGLIPWRHVEWRFLQNRMAGCFLISQRDFPRVAS
jgi:Restriction endonuclease